ncbi:MAG: thioredoxin domain-containing protein [Rhizobiaceae bacterium]|nr:thioredoxin domain-containing protein [Rhizobiaceae bacterium]
MAYPATLIAEENRKPNKLLGVESPYLQQHVYNAVDWYPWGKEALDKAKNEGKLIFLSVGYSTCYWCHVMARESFENDKIGKFLNDNFVSIKLDRERRPDLDEQYMLVTQVIAGSGGWPNSVFLTPDGDPFFAGTYFPPDAFMKVLGQVNNLWSEDKLDVSVEGERIAAIVKTYMSRTEAARALTPEAIRAAARDMLPGMDEFNGGFGVAPKFPQESALLFMLDQAERDGDRELLEAVTGALDGMLKGGIQDHVGGGFHRYVIDPQWQIPHFEKMLYNQAMIGRLLVRAWSATGELRYKHAATRAFDYVLREMRDERGGFFSAQDAESYNPEGVKEEGIYYTWTPEQVKEALGEDAEFALDALNITADGNFEGTNILHMIDLPLESAEGMDVSEEAYLQRLDGVLAKLYAARLKRTEPHKDEKIVVAWNAMMIETLAEAAKVFSRPDYYQAAEAAMKFIVDEMLHDDGLKRVAYEQSIGVEAQLPDYAGLGTALLALYDYAPAGSDVSQYLELATKMAGETSSRFSNGENNAGGAYRMSASLEGMGSFLPYEDNEIPSGNALALSLLTGLSKRLGDPQYVQKANLLAASLSGPALGSPIASGYTLLSAQALSHGEIGAVRFMADGAVRVATSVDKERTEMKFEITVKDGWHINANKPLEDYFIPTQLSIDGVEVASETYPEPAVMSLKFNAKPMALYDGKITLRGKLPKPDGDKTGKMILMLQACSDKICLLPEEVQVTVW